MTIMAHQNCISAMNIRKVGQVSSSSYPLDKYMYTSRTYDVQEFPNPSSSPTGSSSHFVL